MQPIIRTLLDVDLYKLTMLQFIFHRYPRIPVRFEFVNRTTETPLADRLDMGALRDELDHVRTLRLTRDELDYLAGITVDGARIFPDRRFLTFLARFELSDYELDTVDGRLRLRFSGAWCQVTLWETFALSIVNALYYRARLVGGSALREARRIGIERLNAKIRMLRTRPDVTFIEFGTRRRFSRAWQAEVVRRLQEACPHQLVGTSNVALARRYDLQPVGTMAHELFMVLAAHVHAVEGNAEAIRASHGRVLDAWWDEYGAPLSIALTDTFGTAFAFRDVTPAQAALWKGQRQDSGSPFAFVDDVCRFYRERGVDPGGKLIVFSDGLTIDTIVAIADYAGDRIGRTFGWGTDLTNDVGFEPLAIVVKAVEASGMPTVKLSDNRAKVTGPEALVAFYKSVFGYRSSFAE